MDDHEDVKDGSQWFSMVDKHWSNNGKSTIDIVVV